MAMDFTDIEMCIKTLEGRVARLQEALEASEYECFEERQRALRAESRLEGYKNRLILKLGLEIDGIKDLIPFVPKEAIASILERCARMQQILEEEEL